MEPHYHKLRKIDVKSTMFNFEPKIVHEDADLIVFSKPAGWIVNDAQTTKGQNVIQSWLRDNFDYPIANDFDFRSGVVHRLDKETSGILLIAKNQVVFRALQRQFKDRLVSKTYIALTHGKIEPTEGLIDVPVGRLPWNRRRFGVLPGGKISTTSYKVIETYKNKLNNDIYSLAELYPKTGRTHQIRVHLKYIGHPIVSDEFYAGRKTSRKDKLFCPRLFLHAYKIEFNHPTAAKRVSYKAELPSDLQKVVESLEKLQ
jgi:23S rRNA pseudouridine1911/1915/1917 synthase